MDDLLDYFSTGSEFDNDIFSDINNISGVENIIDGPMLTPPPPSMLDNIANTTTTSTDNDNSQNIVGPSQPPVQANGAIKKKKKGTKPADDINIDFATPSARVNKRLRMDKPSSFSEPSLAKIVKKVMRVIQHWQKI